MKKLVIVIGIILASLFVFGINCYAQQVYGCRQKNDGQVRIVNGPGLCRASEIPVSWNMIGPAGPPGPAGPQGPQGPAGPSGPAGPQADQVGLTVYDAKGTLLGPLAGMVDGYISVYIPTLSKFISISPVTGDIDPNFSWGHVYYLDTGTTALCSGTPYLDLSMRYEVFKLDSNYLMADDNELAVSIQFNRYKSTDYTKCTVRNAVSVNALPAKKVTFPFAMPVSLPLQIK